MTDQQLQNTFIEGYIDFDTNDINYHLFATNKAYRDGFMDAASRYDEEYDEE